LSDKTGTYKLTIELIPSTVWFSSVFQILNERGERDKWQHIKSELFKIEGRRCWICRTEQGRLEAHEFWDYDDNNHVQKLASIHHLCDLCHEIKHIGFWCHTVDGQEKLAKLGLSEKDLVEHFCKVNNCEEKDFRKHESQAFKIWKERSNHKWKQDFGGYV